MMTYDTKQMMMMMMMMRWRWWSLSNPLRICMKHDRQHVAQRKVAWVNKIVVMTIKFAENCL
jgi:hypothetical protein